LAHRNNYITGLTGQTKEILVIPVLPVLPVGLYYQIARFNKIYRRRWV